MNYAHRSSYTCVELVNFERFGSVLLRKLKEIYKVNLLRFTALMDWFTPTHAQPDTLSYFRYQSTIALSLIVGSSGFPFMLLFFWMGYDEPGTVVLWSFLIFYLIPWLVRWGVSPKLGAHLVSANYFQCHLCLSLLFGGVYAPNTMWFVALPLFSILIGGLSNGIIWGLISVATISTLYGLEFFYAFKFKQILTPSETLFVHTAGSIGLMFAVLGSAIAFELLKSLALERRKLAEESLVAANMELKTLDAQKTAFFQNISHELRTPLTLILNPLEEAHLELPNRQDLSVALKNTRRLLRLVNQLLDFQKLRAGKRVMKKEHIELSHFTYLCGDYLRSACQSKGIKLSVTCNGEMLIAQKTGNYWVKAEVDALEKIVFNFLSNAFKFTDKGGEIELGLSADEDLIEIFVRDTGPGISKEDQAKLFDVFTQVDASATRAYEGSGLGLALVKSLTEELNGQVGVFSELGQGSTFWIRLPRTLDRTDTSKSVHLSSQERVSEADLSNFAIKDWLLEAGNHSMSKNSDHEIYQTPTVDSHNHTHQREVKASVLVIDDLSDMRNLIMRALRRSGYTVMSAENGKYGLEVAHAKSPDLIITDWMMPEMSGPQLISELRLNPKLADIPVVLLTAKSDEESKLLGAEIGADAFLGKPFNKQELLSITQNLLSLKSHQREVESLSRMLTEDRLKHHLPPALVERVIKGEVDLCKIERRAVAIMSADIDQFSTTLNRINPLDIIDFISTYLDIMAEVIFDHDGMIAQLIGDEIRVIFGTPIKTPSSDQAQQAIHCSLAMHRAFAHLTKRYVSPPLSQLKLRVGIHHGEALLGHIGRTEHTKYTCIGSAVQLASLIKNQCTPGMTCISEEVRLLLDSSHDIDRLIPIDLGELSEVSTSYQICHPTKGLD